MAENSLMDSGFKGMSFSTPVNPCKLGNPLTPESVSSVDAAVNISNAMQVTDLTPQTSSHRESQQDRYSTDLFTHPRKFNKPIKNPANYDGTRCYVIVLNTLSVSLLLI